MEVIICTDRDWLLSEEAFFIYASCMYKPTVEKYRSQLAQYLADPSVKIIVCKDQSEKIGMLVLVQSDHAAEIVGIAVRADRRHHGIGKWMIQQVMESGNLEKITAQTDEDAIGFYRQCGFSEETEHVEFPDGIGVRYRCEMTR